MKPLIKSRAAHFMLAAVGSCMIGTAVAQDKAVKHQTELELTTPQHVCEAIQSFFRTTEEPGASHAETLAIITTLIPGWPFIGVQGSQSEHYQGLQKGLTLSLQWTVLLAANLGIKLGTLPLTDCRATADPNLLVMVLNSQGRDLPFGIYVEWIWTGYLVRRLSADGLIERLKEADRSKSRRPPNR